VKGNDNLQFVWNRTLWILNQRRNGGSRWVGEPKLVHCAKREQANGVRDWAKVTWAAAATAPVESARLASLVVSGVCALKSNLFKSVSALPRCQFAARFRSFVSIPAGQSGSRHTAPVFRCSGLPTDCCIRRLSPPRCAARTLTSDSRSSGKNQYLASSNWQLAGETPKPYR
jgi:hypothetical protein